MIINAERLQHEYHRWTYQYGPGLSGLDGHGPDAIPRLSTGPQSIDSSGGPESMPIRVILHTKM